MPRFGKVFRDQLARNEMRRSLNLKGHGCSEEQLKEFGNLFWAGQGNYDLVYRHPESVFTAMYIAA